MWALATACAALLTAACATAPTGPELPATGGTVRVVGSDTMLVLDRRLAEEFMRRHRGVAVQVRGGGTGVGVAALVDGSAELCAASRPLAPEEVRALHERHGTLGVRFLIGQDALSVYLNPANPVRDLTVEQLAGLFSGATRSWAELDGADRPVVPVVRPPSSGTYRFFQEHVLEGEAYATGAVTAARTVDVVTAVRSDPGAVGYGGLAYAEGVVTARIGGAPATTEAVRSGAYPLSRYLHFYTVEPPRGWTKAFVDWVMGPEGQRVVAEVGYVPIWAGG